MIEIRAALLAASMAAAGCVSVAYAASERASVQPVVMDQEPSPALRVTSPPGADPARTYEEPKQALLEADLDYLVREAHRAVARGDEESIWRVLLFADDVTAGRNSDARSVLEGAPGGLRGGIADILEPFLLASEGQVDRGVERVDQGGNDLPAPLPDVARALLFESAGRLNEAAAVYSQMEEGLDLTPPPQREPTNLEEFQRSLNAGRITHAIYRAALVQHRLGHAAEARRLYGIVTQFAPRSADVERNLARLDRGEQPLEPPLDAKSATGRWLLFVSEFLTQSENLSQAMARADPEPGLSSASGALFLQLGIVLDPGANDWRLYAANELVDAGGLDGAERIIAQMPADSVFAADAEIVRAAIALERKDDAAAVAAAERALATGADRWSVVASAGDIYRSVGPRARSHLRLRPRTHHGGNTEGPRRHSRLARLCAPLFRRCLRRIRRHAPSARTRSQRRHQDALCVDPDGRSARLAGRHPRRARNVRLAT
ncbi:MAG: hypothetical protein WDM79_08180 [Terricaulis sp.]